MVYACKKLRQNQIILKPDIFGVPKIWKIQFLDIYFDKWKRSNCEAQQRFRKPDAGNLETSKNQMNNSSNFRQFRMSKNRTLS